MKRILASALAFGLMTSTAMAESAKSKAAIQPGPLVLTSTQLDKVTAGVRQSNTQGVGQVGLVNVGANVGANVGCGVTIGGECG